MSQDYEKPKNSFELQIQTVTIVPSTNFDKKISDKEFLKRTIEVKSWLSKNFGGYTSVKAEGGYLFEGKLVPEKVNMVTAFATKQTFNEKRADWYAQVSKWREKFKQDSMGIIVENDMYYLK